MNDNGALCPRNSQLTATDQFNTLHGMENVLEEIYIGTSIYIY